MSTIVVAEDHLRVRQSLARLLQSLPDMTEVAEARNTLEALECVGRLHPDILIVDLNLPHSDDGLALIQEARRISPGTRVVVCTLHTEGSLIRNALAAGATGFVDKPSTLPHLPLAILSALEGKEYLSPNARSVMTQQ